MWPDSPVLHSYEHETGWPAQPPSKPILHAVPGARPPARPAQCAFGSLAFVLRDI